MPEPLQIIQIFLKFFDSKLFLALQILGGLVSMMLFVAAFVLIKRGGAIQKHFEDLWTSWRATPVPKSRMVKRWVTIKRAMEADDSQKWREAIMEADLMLGEVVEKLGYSGNDLEERLNNVIPEQFESIENAWRAHQISVFLREDPSYTLTREVADRTIEIYESIFRDTGILL